MNQERITRLLADMLFCAETIDIGTKDRPRKKTRIQVTQERLTEWQSEQMPSNDHRGGSSSPVEVEERLEDRMVAANAIRDELQVASLLLTLEGTLQRLRFFVTRYTVPVDHGQLPDGPAGCVSCARPRRVGKKLLPGPFSPVYEKSKRLGLCRWCYEHTIGGEWPPVEFAHMYNESPRKAGLEFARWLDKQQKKAGENPDSEYANT